MNNNAEKAASWVDFLASHPGVPFGSELRRHFLAGKISRLCDCGCNSFDVEIAEGAELEPLCPPSDHGGMFFEIAFESDAEAEIDFLVFADKRGYLAGVDVTCGLANHAPFPDKVTIGKVMYVA